MSELYRTILRPLVYSAQTLSYHLPRRSDFTLAFRDRGFLTGYPVMARQPRMRLGRAVATRGPRILNATSRPSRCSLKISHVTEQDTRTTMEAKQVRCGERDNGRLAGQGAQR